jgi:hypothetical protein
MKFYFFYFDSDRPSSPASTSLTVVAIWVDVRVWKKCSNTKILSYFHKKNVVLPQKFKNDKN